MITLREYEDDDWLKINDAVEPFMFHEPLGEFNRIVQRGLAVTAVEDGNIMVCGGVALINDEEGIVWVKVSKKCLDRPIKFARGIRDVFREMMKAFGSIKVTTYILEKFCRGEKLAKLIGMEKSEETSEFEGKVYKKYMVVT